MGLRRDGREAAIQFLYQHDLHKPKNLDEALKAFWKQTDEKKAVCDFADDLLRGALPKLPEVDAGSAAWPTTGISNGWPSSTRNILRLTCRSTRCFSGPEIPPVVSINEAIEIAKKFSTAESGKFVNGLLDRVKDELLRPARHSCGGQ